MQCTLLQEELGLRLDPMRRRVLQRQRRLRPQHVVQQVELRCPAVVVGRGRGIPQAGQPLQIDGLAGRRVDQRPRRRAEPLRARPLLATQLL